MRRISHDLRGTVQRVAKLSGEFETMESETRLAWPDEKGRAFLQQHASEVQPTVAQLLAAISKAADIFEEISKKLQDPSH